VQRSAGSQILEGYNPEFEATVLFRLTNKGAIIIATTCMDEFGFGSFNTNVGLGKSIPKNPHDPRKVTGGSSGGSAAATAALMIRHVSVAESTGGSIETPAAFCGVYGFCPTYGTLSRHGVISYADSLDKIGFMSQKIEDINLVLQASAGADRSDSTSKVPVLRPATKMKRIGVLPYAQAQSSVIDIFETHIDKLKQEYTVENVHLPITHQYGLAAYYTLAVSEASTNLAKYCGLRYGKQEPVDDKQLDEYMTQIRSQHFGSEAKRRILMGTYMRSAGYRQQYYLKAKDIQKAIRKEYQKLFENYDVLISPTVPITAPSIDEVQNMSTSKTYETDQYTVGPNLAGVPHISVPISAEIGMLVSADMYEDLSLLQFVNEVPL
jgi:aspartyl-tRNA(Asn)/glutamyl-tRNA(Gln) amidotransferase subunit A